MPSFYEKKRNKNKAQEREALRLKITTEYNEVLSSSKNPTDIVDGLFHLTKLGLLDFFKRQKPDIIDVLGIHPAPSQACAGLIALYQLELFRYGTRSEDCANFDAIMNADPKNNAAIGVAGLMFLLKKNNILTPMNRKKILAHPEPWELYSSWINDFGNILLTLKTPNAQWVFDEVAEHAAPREAITLLLLLAKLKLLNDPATAKKHMVSALHCKAPALLTKALIHLNQSVNQPGFCLENTLSKLSLLENPWDAALKISEDQQEATKLMNKRTTSFQFLQSQTVVANKDNEQEDVTVISPCNLL